MLGQEFSVKTSILDFLILHKLYARKFFVLIQMRAGKKRYKWEQFMLDGAADFPLMFSAFLVYLSLFNACD